MFWIAERPTLPRMLNHRRCMTPLHVMHLGSRSKPMFQVRVHRQDFLILTRARSQPAKMTKPKTKVCHSCQASNTLNRKTCIGCLGSLVTKANLKKKQEDLKNGKWAASVKKNRNSSKVLNSAQLSVSKLHALGYQPIFFIGEYDRKGHIVGDLISHLEPAGGIAKEILMKMRKLYEHLLRKLQAPPEQAAKNGTPAPGPSSDAGPVPETGVLNDEYVLHLEPVPASSLYQPPASSSLSPLPPASSSLSPLPPASSSLSPLPPASSSLSPLPPTSSSLSMLPPAS
ncbi:hypothetical protein D9C73_023371 [Collichthys lucidus]|uniref:Uncharacterized protein n=1 Tax=Collichthys lucidus TaxID=240159 RepID=A0A4U5VJ82_COLLU|nr:hypothetical protein D9C73_023371 [Collichthys lucidus]